MTGNDLRDQPPVNHILDSLVQRLENEAEQSTVLRIAGCPGHAGVRLNGLTIGEADLNLHFFPFFNQGSGSRGQLDPDATGAQIRQRTGKSLSLIVKHKTGLAENVFSTVAQ